MPELRIGSLFSGTGALDMAVHEVLGATTAWFVEYDKAPSKILAHHWPAVPNYGDVTKVDWSQVEPVDVITGGSPCQDLSHAGKRQGMTEGTRSNLWVAMREAIAALRPSLVIWENVRGAYSAAADSEVEPCAGCVGDRPGVSLRALGRVLGDLSELGYDCRWHGLRAADVGAPHGRFRVFVVAHARDGAGYGEWAPPESGQGSPVAAHHDGRGREVDAQLDGEATQDAADRGPRRGHPHGHLLPTPTSSDTNGAGAHGDGGLDLRTAISLLPTPSAEASAGHSGVSWNGDALYRPDGSKISSHVTTTIQHLDAHPSVTPDNPWGIYADAIARWETLTRPAPPPTQPSKKGTPQLSPAFSEWLMGLPAGHVTDVPGLSRNDQLKALGNGVVPQQAAAALRFLLSVQAVAA